MAETAAERIRAQARVATRKALLEAGLAVTIDQGGQFPSIEGLCARAGYTRGAFYVYFKDREQFIAEMLEWVLTDILELLFQVTTAGAADLAEVITRFSSTIAAGDWPDLHKNVRIGYIAVLRELRQDSPIRDRHAEIMQRIIARLEVLVRDGQASGRVRGDLPAHSIAVNLLLSAVGSVMWSDVGIDFDPEAVGKVSLALLSTEDQVVGTDPG